MFHCAKLSPAFAVSILALVAVGAAGCGGSSKGTGYNQAFEAGSKNCSAQFLTEIKQIGAEANQLNAAGPTDEQRASFKSKVQAFCGKYEGVVCNNAELGDNGTNTIDISSDCKQILAPAQTAPVTH